MLFLCVACCLVFPSHLFYVLLLSVVVCCSLCFVWCSLVCVGGLFLLFSGCLLLCVVCCLLFGVW